MTRSVKNYGISGMELPGNMRHAESWTIAYVKFRALACSLVTITLFPGHTDVLLSNGLLLCLCVYLFEEKRLKNYP